MNQRLNTSLAAGLSAAMLDDLRMQADQRLALAPEAKVRIRASVLRALVDHAMETPVISGRTEPWSNATPYIRPDATVAGQRRQQAKDWESICREEKAREARKAPTPPLPKRRYFDALLDIARSSREIGLSTMMVPVQTIETLVQLAEMCREALLDPPVPPAGPSPASGASRSAEAKR